MDHAQLKKFIEFLKGYRLNLTDEKETQIQVESILQEKKIDHKREYRLDPHSIIDFFFPDNEVFPGVGIEIKLKGGKREIYNQCVRYCNFEEVKGLVLVSNVSLGLPPEINGKPVTLYKLGIAWL